MLDFTGVDYLIKLNFVDIKPLICSIQQTVALDGNPKWWVSKADLKFYG